MRPIGLCAAIAFTFVSLLLGSTRAQAQPPQSGPGSFRAAPSSQGTSGVGFYSRSYRAPGFSPVPAPPNYNAVSFYGRSYRAPGFSPSPTRPSYNVVSFYGRSYNAPGFSPAAGLSASAVGPSGPNSFAPGLSVVSGSSDNGWPATTTINIPRGFSPAYGLGSYYGSNYYAPGSFPSNSSGE